MKCWFMRSYLPILLKGVENIIKYRVKVHHSFLLLIYDMRCICTIKCNAG